MSKMAVKRGIAREALKRISAIQKEEGGAANGGRTAAERRTSKNRGSRLAGVVFGRPGKDPGMLSPVSRESQKKGSRESGARL